MFRGLMSRYYRPEPKRDVTVILRREGREAVVLHADEEKSWRKTLDALREQYVSKISWKDAGHYSAHGCGHSAIYAVILAELCFFSEICLTDPLIEGRAAFGAAAFARGNAYMLLCPAKVVSKDADAAARFYERTGLHPRHETDFCVQRIKNVGMNAGKA